MSTTSGRPRRTGAVALIGAGLVVALTGCGGGAEPGPDAANGPVGDVVTQVGEQLAASGLATDPGSLSCNGALPAQAGASVRCSFTSDDQPVDLVARAASVDGSAVDVEITTEARPVPKLVLEQAVGDRVAVAISRTVSSTVCDGDLPPTVGASTGCTLSSDGLTRAVRVAVTSVEGGSVGYSIDNA